MPGTVARPVAESGHGSKFVRLIFHRIKAGQDYDLPVGMAARCWSMSRQTGIDNLVNAARMVDTSAARVWQLPVLHVPVGAMFAALHDRFGGRAKIVPRPDPALIEAACAP